MKKKHFANVLLLIISTVISFLALEQSYRFYLFGTASFSTNKMNSINGLGELGLLEPSNNPEIIFELKPNLSVFHKLVPLETNSAGLRDKEYSISKPDNSFRVAVIGDSFIMADGIAIEETFHSLLEERLNKEQGNTTYQFINFGVSAYSLKQYLEVMKYKAMDYDPDLILIGFCPRNDQYIPEEQKYRDVPKTYPFFHFYSIQAFIDIFNRGTYYDDDIYYMEKELTRNKPFSDMQSIYMSQIFSEMKDFREQHNIPIVVVYLDVFYNKNFADELEKIVLKKDLNFVNASLPFKGQEFEEYIIYPIDSHPNGKAHSLFADEIYNYLILGNEENKNFLSREME